MLFNYAQRMGLHFITVDFSRDIYERAREIVDSRAFHMTGEDFLDLRSLPSLVSFAYLDNFDWIWEAHQNEQWILDQIQDYAKKNVVMNNLNSQLAHLRQSMKLLPNFEDRCAVLFDDTWRRWDGCYDGKGGAAVPFLLTHGFKDISPDMDKDYVLLGRNLMLS